MPFLGGIFVCFLFVVAVMVVVVQLEFNSKSIGKPVSSKRWYPPNQTVAGSWKSGICGFDSRFTAHALRAMDKITQAMIKAVKPTPTVKLNMASNS